MTEAISLDDRVHAPVKHMGTAHLTWQQGLGVLFALLLLNSVLASLGSILWSYYPYWPAFMISALTCAFWGPWGLLLSVLSPVVSCLLGIGGAPSYLYVPINLIQALCVLGAMRQFRIDPKLPNANEIMKYLAFMIILPSGIGASSAWYLRHVVDHASGDASLMNYAGWWTAENLFPAIFPGIWLHRIIGELDGVGTLKRKQHPMSWMLNVIYYSTPWMLSLLLVGALVAAMVWNQLHTFTVTPAIWNRVYQIAGESTVFRLLVLSICISILCSLGIAIQFGRRSWVIEQEIAKRLPFRLESTMPSGRHTVTVLFTDIREFTKTSAMFPPDELVAWLNTYFDRMCMLSAKHHGYVDKFIGDGLMLVFGLNKPETGACDAIECAMAMLAELKVLNDEFVQGGYPAMRMGIGIHTGPVIAGEIGSRHRLQFTVIGSTVNIAARLESKCKSLGADAVPAVISDETIRDAGLLLEPGSVDLLTPFMADDLYGVTPMQVWAIRDPQAILERVRKCVDRKRVMRSNPSRH